MLIFFYSMNLRIKKMILVVVHVPNLSIKKSYLSNHLKRSKNCRLSQKPTKPTKPATTSNETVFECTACNNTFKSNKAFLKHCKFTCKNKSGEVKEF